MSTDQLSPLLSEQDVKQRFVPFLKDFYRNRYEPLPNSMEVSFNNVTAEGLVADGVLRFKHPNGASFVCTYEASSREKVDEVKFTLNIHYFLWDCAAFGAVTMAVAYLVAYASNPTWLVLLGWTGNFGMLLGIGMIGFLSWYFTMNKWRKYRYIYALEQFKQYQADEQWVALAADVFPAPTDPYLLELKSQCVYNGFGLGIVPEEGPVRVICAPTRLGAYAQERKMVEWITDQEWFQRASQNIATVRNMQPPGQLTALFQQLLRPVNYLVLDPLRKYVWKGMSKPLGHTATAYNRFMGAHLIQKWIFFVALALVVPFLYQTMQRRNSSIADMDLERIHEGQNPEDYPNDLYLSGATPIPFKESSGVPKQYPTKRTQQETAPAPRRTNTASGIEDDEVGSTVQTINLSGDEPPKVAKAVPKTQPKTATPPKNTATPKAPKPQMSSTGQDACSLIKGRKGWIVQDNVFSKKTNAENRAKTLLELQLTATILPRTCVDPKQKGYILWVGPIYASEAAAKKGAANATKVLKKGEVAGQLTVKKLPE